jgi:hypothetical protein
MGSLIAFGMLGLKARAEKSTSDWGDLGYSKGVEPIAIPRDEAIPEEEALATAPEVGSEAGTEASDPLTKLSDPPPTEVEVETPRRATSSATSISTVKNTYGVLTEENKPIRIFGAPILGFGSVVGMDAAEVSPRYALGASVGFLISNHILINASYVHQIQDFANPRTLAMNPVPGFPVFTLKQDVIDAGAKLFILGRESRFRPFVGGGVSWTKGVLNYSQENLAMLYGQAMFIDDFTLSQFGGYGELGAEIAITKDLVANLGFKFSGVLTSSTTNDKGLNYSIDPSKSDVGNSVSRSLSYLLGAGVGIYF